MPPLFNENSNLKVDKFLEMNSQVLLFDPNRQYNMPQQVTQQTLTPPSMIMTTPSITSSNSTTPSSVHLNSSTEILYNAGTSTPVSNSLQTTSPSTLSSTVSTEQIENCLKQIKKKSTYNQYYYQDRTKPKKMAEKEELRILREKVTMYETQLKMLMDERTNMINNMSQLVTVVQELETKCKKLFEDNVKLMNGEQN